MLRESMSRTQRISLQAATVLLVWSLSALAVSAATLHVPDDFETIGAAVAASVSGDTIAIAPAVYAGALNKNIDPAGRDLVFVGVGGWDVTIIDCEGDGRGFNFQSGETGATEVRGLTVCNGDVWTNERTEPVGGAIRCYESGPTIVDCAFENCKAISGGGIFVQRCSVRVEDCVFLGNFGSEGGGVCFYHSEDGLVRGCLFAENKGAGIVMTLETPAAIEECQFIRNDFGAGYSNGVLAWGRPSPSIRNCTFVGNRSAPPIDCIFSDPKIDASIFAFNGSTPVTCWHSTPVIRRSVFYSNALGDSLCGDYADNRFMDPLLCDHVSGDVSLCADSPCLPGNSPWGELVGALGEGCPPCETACESITWGGVKALYR